MEDGYVDVGDEIHYLTAGSGRPVVLLHGGVIDAARVSWGGLIEPLAEDYRVVAPDLLGYGESDLPDGPYPVSRHVDVVAGLVDALDLDDPAVVGTSLGGGVGLGVALQAPDAVSSLVLVDSYGLGSDLPNGRLSYFLARFQVLNELSVALLRRSRRLTRLSLAGLVADLADLDSAAVDAVHEELQRPTAGEAFRRFRAAEVTRHGYATTFVDRFDEVTVPTRVVHGADDELFPVAWAERAAGAIPDAELAVLENCGHWAPRDRPAAVLELIRDSVPE